MRVQHVLRALSAAAVFAAPALPALSEPAPSPSPSAPPEITRVVTSDRSDETLHNSVRTTFVVTKDDIARHGYRTVADALTNVPGVELNAYGTIGSNVAYGVRGSSSTEVLVLIDGLPAPGSFGNTVTLSELPTAGVRRIEIVEGGGSTLYGTGAIGGIINVITDGSHSGTNAELRYGSLGDREADISGYGFTFTRVVADNAYGIPAANIGGVAVPTTRSNADYESSAVHYGLDRKLGTFDASLRAGLASSHLGAPGGLSFLSNSSREDDVNGDAELTLTHRSAQALATLQLGGSNQIDAFGCDPVNDANCFQPQQAVNREARVEAGLRNAVTGARERLQYGIDLSRGVVRNDTGGAVTPPTPPIATNALAQTAAYVEQTFELAHGARFYAGLRGERDGALGGEISPSLGLALPITSDATLKLNAATAFRAPNASELYFPGFGNPALHPERAKVGDATLDLPSLFGGTQIGWFTNRTNELIVTELVDPATFTYAPENVDHALLQGFTFSTRTHERNHVSATLNATDLYRAQNVDTGVRLPNDAVFSVNLGLLFTGSMNSAFYDGGFDVRAIGARGTVDPTLPAYAQSAAYSTTDAFARFRLTNRVLLGIRAFNLGNERYAEISGYPMPGRTFSIELSTR